MPKAVVDGIGLAYRQIGAGEDVVLVHGLAANMAFWHPEVLRTLRERFRVTLYDLRGHGYSDMPSTGYAMDDMAGDLHGLLDRLGIETMHLVGHSWGGAIAATLAATHPARVRSLALADARLPALQPTLRAEDFPHWQRWWSAFHEAGIEVAAGQSLDFTLLELLADPRLGEARRRIDVPEVFVPFGGWNAGRRGAARWLRLLASTSARRDFTAPGGIGAAELATVAVPVLAVYGEYSHCLPTLRALERHLPGCHTLVCPRGGHFHPAVHPAFFAAALDGFLPAAREVRAHGHPSIATGGEELP